MRGGSGGSGGSSGSNHRGHDGDDGELELVLALVGVLLLGVLVGRCHEVILDRRGRSGCGGCGHVALDLVMAMVVVVVIGVDIVVQDRRHVEEIVVIWIDHKALQHCFVALSVFQIKRRCGRTVA